MARHFFRATLALILSAIAAWCGLLARSDLAFFDGFSRVRLAVAGAAPRDGLPVVVAIDGPALRQYGRWPWPRPLLARLLRRIGAGEPAAVGLDLLLAEPASGDGELAAAIRGHRVILAERLDLRRTGRISLEGARPEPPLPDLAAAAIGRGFIDFFPDPDGVARRMLGRLRIGEAEHLSLAALCQRLREADRLAEEMTFCGVKERLRSLIDRLVERKQDTLLAELTHQGIAEMIGTSRESVTRAMAELRRERGE